MLCRNIKKVTALLSAVACSHKHLNSLGNLYEFSRNAGQLKEGIANNIDASVHAFLAALQKLVVLVLQASSR